MTTDAQGAQAELGERMEGGESVSPTSSEDRCVGIAAASRSLRDCDD